jgi:hypothetical protein
LVDLNVRNNEGFSVQTLDNSVAFNVLQKAEDELARLLGPARLATTVTLVDLGLALSVSGNTTSEATERNGSLVGNNVFQELLSSLKSQTLDGSSGFAGVLNG